MIAPTRDRTHRIGATGLIVMATIGVFGFVLRAEPILTRNRALSTAQFDEGVYTSAVGGLVSGDVPYRDFVFDQPPGVTLLLAPIASLARAVGSWSDLLVAARWVMALIALVNVALAGCIAWRWKGWLAGVIAGALYASYWPAVRTEGHVMLEPLVVLCILASALLWVGSPGRSRTDARSLLAGGTTGLAVVMKLTGGIALFALIFAERLRAPWRQRSLALAAATGIVGVALLPFVVLASPVTVLEQIVMTQFQRPGHDIAGGTISGVVDRLDHLGSYGPFALEQLGGSAGVMGAVLAAALIVWAWRSGDSTGRFFAIVAAGGAIAILSSPDYYDQYPVAVFAGIAVLVGGAAANALEATSRGRRLTRSIAMLSIALCLAAGVADTFISFVEDAKDRQVANPTVSIADVIKTKCVSADVPEVLLSLDRIPPRDDTGGRLVDPFGELMFMALQHRHYTTTASALHSKPAQERLRQLFVACPYAVTQGPLDSPPPRWSNSTRAWFLSHFHPDIENEAGLTLWRRIDRR